MGLFLESERNVSRSFHSQGAHAHWPLFGYGRISGLGWFLSTDVSLLPAGTIPHK
jgi:hypothetical protein